ncbi:hypothetical protein L2U69_04435 [Zavarzinia compransoris]|uniref:hypothetical protein n=1 Tax=Zavarzinia marina TaxID=2911065 RepID=UPI001F2E0531|nr:hypothetical protein [Zavarzinia marina]MCF4164884.1 hypothetical protein [Zavarzinia marina]
MTQWWTGMDRMNRLYVLPARPGAVAVRILLSGGKAYDVHLGTLKESMARARELALELMEQQDRANGDWGGDIRLQSTATLLPITAYEAGADDHALIVATCLDVIRDCPDSSVRLKAARLLANLKPVAGIRSA